MSYWPTYGIAALTILFLMSLHWLVSLKLKNTSIVDVFWGFGFIIVNRVTFFISQDNYPLRSWILIILVTLWGLRLTTHIFLRNGGVFT
jgi:steroid 5-alpha reductase family enzyme